MRQARALVACMAGVVLLLLFVDIRDLSLYSSIPKISEVLLPKDFYDEKKEVDSGVGGEKEENEESKRDQTLLFPQIKKTSADIEVDGHTIQISKQSAYEEKPLKVSILLHSHVDPGWLETFEEYYTGKVNRIYISIIVVWVRHILDLAVKWLTAEQRLRFIWSETSFLERWWKDASDEQRSQMKKLVSSGHLEVCGGAWVMTDEATPHFSASVDNIIEGQRYVDSILSVRPNVSWSVDPFGHGLMMPSLLPLAGVRRMVVGRLNDMIKAKMREAMTMRFNWKQPYSTADGKMSVEPSFVNTLPYLYYTTRNGCGPQDSVCCKYHVGPSASYCGGTIHQISNVAQHAEELLGQYRQVQRLYNTEDVLITVGDDFYLTKEGDWKEVVEVYGAIADYLDKTPSLKAKMVFSTVSEFFARLGDEPQRAPTLSGDFFPYTQNERSSQTWWTGYFSHRPFYKRVGKLLEWKLHTFDVLNVVSRSARLNSSLSTARRDIALFQHHDAITGTSKKHVMDDYFKRLTSAHRVISAEQAAALSVLSGVASDSLMSLDETPTDESVQMPPDYVIRLTENKKVSLLVFNQRTDSSYSKIRVVVDTESVRVVDEKGQEVAGQIGPLFLPRNTLPEKGLFEVIFVARASLLNVTTFTVENQKSSLIRPAEIYSNSLDSKFKPLSTSNVEFKNDRLNLTLSAGDVSNVVLDGRPLNVSFDFSTEQDAGGSYVFEWMHLRKNLSRAELTFFVDGPIEKRLITFHANRSVQRVLTLDCDRGSPVLSSLDVRVFPLTPLRESLFFDISTSLFHNLHFSTDVNGLYMMRRTYNKEKNVAANVFPASTSSWIEDGLTRLTVHHGQPNGVVVTPEGEMRIMIDRVLQADDGKGLPYGEDHDTHKPDVHLRLVFERRSLSSDSSSGCCHSIDSSFVLSSLRFPPQLFIFNGSNKAVGHSVTEPSIPWPCELELVTLRMLSEKKALAVIRRLSFDSSVSSRLLRHCHTDMAPAFALMERLASGGVSHCNLAATEVGAASTLDSFRSALSRPFAIASFLLQL